MYIRKRTLLAVLVVLTGAQCWGGEINGERFTLGHQNTNQAILNQGQEEDVAAQVAQMEQQTRNEHLLSAVENITYDPIDAVTNLLQQGANVNATDIRGRTALMLAAKKGYSSTVKKLLEQHAKIDATDIYNDTALMLTAENGHTEIVNLLINEARKPEKNINFNTFINLTDSPTGWTALIMAVRNGHNEVVQALLAAGADVNKSSIKGKTPLMYAVKYGYFDSVKELIEAGADVNRLDQNGYSALDYVFFHINSDTYGNRSELSEEEFKNACDESSRNESNDIDRWCEEFMNFDKIKDLLRAAGAIRRQT